MGRAGSSGGDAAPAAEDPGREAEDVLSILSLLALLIWGWSDDAKTKRWDFDIIFDTGMGSSSSRVQW